LLALLRAHPIYHVSRIRVKILRLTESFRKTRRSSSKTCVSQIV